VTAPRIVIVTDVVDAHADIIISTLAGMGHEPVRVNSTDIPLGTRLAARLDGDAWSGSLRITANGRCVQWPEVTAVWWRKPTGYGLPEDLTGRERDFADEELHHAMHGLWESLDCYWMSRPEDIRRASYKIEQLRRARRLGFDVPRTIVTSDPHAARQFYEECGGRVVYKVLTDPFLSAARTARTAHTAHRHGGGGEADAPWFVPTTLLTDAALDARSTRPRHCRACSRSTSTSAPSCASP
jgi:hypothetical protein